MKTNERSHPVAACSALCSLGFALIASACASSSSTGSPASTPAHADSPTPSAAAPATAAPVGAQPLAADLRGEWVEYWALSGGADTEGYSFTDDGRFMWRAAQKDQLPNAAIERTGTYRVETSGQAPKLVLQVDSERFAPCAKPCTSSQAPRDVHHATPVIESLEIGDCPKNQEAEQLDASYTCRAIGGKAFWRVGRERAQHASGDRTQRG